MGQTMFVLDKEEAKEIMREVMKEAVAESFSDIFANADKVLQNTVDSLKFDKILNTKEVQELLQCSKATILKYCRNGFLAYHKVGPTPLPGTVAIDNRKVYFKQSEVMKCLERGNVTQPYQSSDEYKQINIGRKNTGRRKKVQQD